MRKPIIPFAAMEKLLRSADANIRISDDAKKELNDYLEEIGEKISKKSINFSRHANRKTIKKEDVVLAKKQV
ncbi:histone [Candidatus Woesearchaeota archaeon]|nr:histone [Candidatus Woesearchaeota archaeon]